MVYYMELYNDYKCFIVVYTPYDIVSCYIFAHLVYKQYLAETSSKKIYLF